MNVYDFSFQPVHSDESRMKPTRGTQWAARVALRCPWMLQKNAKRNSDVQVTRGTAISLNKQLNCGASFG